MAITAHGNVNGHMLTDVPVLSPGEWFGKTWLVEVGGSYSSLHLAVEADSICDAIDELADEFPKPDETPGRGSSALKVERRE